MKLAEDNVQDVSAEQWYHFYRDPHLPGGAACLYACNAYFVCMLTAFYVRTPRPDAKIWPGRRALGVADALGWAALVCLAVSMVRAPMGVVGPVVMASALVLGAVRAHRAWFQNHRYRFVSARLALVGAVLLAVGLVVRWMA